MPSVGVVVDSVCCLPDEVIRENGIRVIPFVLSLNGKPYHDQTEITPAQFWKLFPEMKEFSTGAPGTGEIADIFMDVGKSTPDICCVSIAKKLSAMNEAMVQGAALAKSQVPGLNIEIVDSNTIAGGEGFVALEAARAARAGKNLKEVVAVAAGMVPRVKVIMVLDTLKYIIRSGRAPKAAYVAEIVHLKPLVGFTKNLGTAESLGQAVGKDKAIAKMLKMVEALSGGRPLHIIVHYTDNINEGEKLRGLITSRFKCEEILMTPYTPVMCGHTGPLVAVSFFA